MVNLSDNQLKSFHIIWKKNERLGVVEVLYTQKETKANEKMNGEKWKKMWTDTVSYIVQVTSS